MGGKLHSLVDEKYALNLAGTAQEHRENSNPVNNLEEVPNRQEVEARRRRLAAKHARRVRATDGAQQLCLARTQGDC
ncbi:MAG: hypothetical protein RBU37_24110 [Myxococcota bacterium]|nr:hypothetical protein [Myxococcota bacterium]